MSDKLKVGILGATGMVGQRFNTLLDNHPWFEVTTLAASKSSAGKTYEEAVKGRWKMDTPIPEAVKNIVVKDVADVEDIAKEVDFVFSAVNMGKEEIKAIEEAYAKAETPVVSNNSAHRWTPDVPMVIPEINPEHYAVIEDQRKRLGTKKGFIAVKPNCSIQSYTPCLAAWKEFEPTKVVVSTYQAISGAGKTFKEWPEMVGNIIPLISGEEEKSEQEPLKVFGHIENGEIVKAEGPVISAQCIRVPVLNGHTATVSISFKKKPTKEELIDRLNNFKGQPQEFKLPHAPEHFIRYMEEENRPQVTLDVDYEGGMGVSIGRLREDNIFDYKFVGLSHNTLRGAAGGAVESAEMLTKLGYITLIENAFKHGVNSRKSSFVRIRFKAEGDKTMRAGIHPNYKKVKVICTSCGNEFETGSVLDEIRVDTCSNCHPFYTGKQRFASADGRVEKFNKKYGLK